MAFQVRDIATLESLIKQEKSLAILFSDDSILTTFAVEPEFDLMSQQARRTLFVKVDLAEVPEAHALAAQNGMTTVNFYKRGSLKRSIPGFNLHQVKGTILQNVV